MSALHAAVVADNTADIDAAIAAGAGINATDAVSNLCTCVDCDFKFTSIDTGIPVVVTGWSHCTALCNTVVEVAIDETLVETGSRAQHTRCCERQRLCWQHVDGYDKCVLVIWLIRLV